MNKLIDILVNKFKNLSRVSKVTLLVVFILGFFGLLLQTLYPDIPPGVYSITPETLYGIDEDSDFEITFNKVLDESTKKKLSLKITPEITSDNHWKENNYQYTINNTGKLKLNTTYTIAVLYKGKEIYSKEYLTSRYTLEEQAEHVKEQGEADIKFNEAVTNLRLQFSWYDDIPIDTSQYTIVYDYDEKKFRIRLKIPKDSSQETIQTLTDKALKDMKDVNIDTAKWGYYVLFSE